MIRSCFKSSVSRSRLLIWPLSLLLISLVLLLPDHALSQSSTPRVRRVYGDVSLDNVHSDNIFQLKAAGIIGGTECTSNEFCPDQPLSRRTFAVWMVRVLDGDEAPDFVDPAVGGRSRFADVGADEREALFIDRLAELGVTAGCKSEPLRYCPETSVSRAQMASFLSRAFQLPPAAEAGFADVSAENVHRDNINRLSASGITAGCKSEPKRYCPQQATTRAQMASFLARAMTWRDGESSQQESIADAEAYMVQLVNELRESLGLPALIPHPGVAAVARSWSNEMAESGEFVHNPVYAAQLPDGPTASGENIGFVPHSLLRVGGDAVRILFDGLSRSPGHYANMIRGRFSHIGIGMSSGIEGVYVTQNFACYPPNAETRRCDDDDTASSATEVMPPEPIIGPQPSIPQQFIPCGGEDSARTYTTVNVSVYQVGIMYAVRTDGTLACLTIDSLVPSGTFIAVSSGDSHHCALKTDRTLACWQSGRKGRSLSYAPAGEFSDIAAGHSHSCALRLVGSIVCWGWDSAGETDAPSGIFKSVTAGYYYSCGLRIDSTVACWGYSRFTNSPSGEFAYIDAGSSHTCGVRMDGTATCWGRVSAGEGDVPAGTFGSVTAGDGISCGIRTDRTVECWGNGFGSARTICRHTYRQFQPIVVGSPLWLRPAHRPDHRLLGQQLLRWRGRQSRRV